MIRDRRTVPIARATPRPLAVTLNDPLNLAEANRSLAMAPEIPAIKGQQRSIPALCIGADPTQPD